MESNQAGGERGMFCRYCGKKNEADSLFCINCGKPLANPSVPKKKPTPPSAPMKEPATPIFPADAFAAQGQNDATQPEQAPVEPNAPFVAREESVASKEPRSFESIGQTMGKKVDEFTRSGNVKVKQLAETIDDKKTIEYFYPAYLISAVVAIVAPFRPYLKVSAFGVSLSANFVRIPAELSGIAGDAAQWGDGIFLMIIAAAAMVAWKLKNKVAMLCVGSGAVVFSAISVKQAQQAKNLIAGTVAENVIHMGIGYYLCILSSFALFAFSFLCYYKAKEPMDEKTK